MEYKDHVRMRKDHPYKDQDGNAIVLKAGEPIDTDKNLSIEQINALILSDLATDNPADHNLFKGSYDPDVVYYTPESVTDAGTLWECIQDTPNPSGVFDPTKWTAKVIGTGV